MKIKFLLEKGLICMMILAGFNFLPQFRLIGIPYFQLLIVFCILIGLFFLKIKTDYAIAEIKYYSWYLLASIPAFLIGLLLEIENSFLVYLYALFPYLLFIATIDIIDKYLYHKLLGILLISMVLITTIGWLLRLVIIPVDTFFDVIDSEFDIGYWGLRYTDSTRNNDYLYPLIGLPISMYFYVLKKYKILNIVLIFFFILTLISSLSRAALIISCLSIVQLIRLSTTQLRAGVIVVLFLVVSFNFNLIMNEYDAKYNLIINSIFKLKDTDNKFSNEARLIIIEDALESSITNPFGYGLCNYSSIYEGNYRENISNSSENAYLTILVERGWLAFIFFINFLYYSFKTSVKSDEINLNKFLIPFLLIYLLFNYELNNVFGNFIFYLVFLSSFFMNEALKSNQVYEQNK